MTTKIMAVANPPGKNQRVLKRAVDLASRMNAELAVVGFVYEHIANLPVSMSPEATQAAQEAIMQAHRKDIEKELEKTAASKLPKSSVEIYWEKRVADWVAQKANADQFDLVIKGGHRTETFTYTPTDWRLLRTSRVPVLLTSEKKWRKGSAILAAVDLGSRLQSKLALNLKVVKQAAQLATALEHELHIAYAIPFSHVLRDLDILDPRELRREGARRADKFQAEVEKLDIKVDAMHVVLGAPEKALVNAAAKNHATIVVLGCVGRKRLAGRVIGNTAEQILRLVKADVLAVKP